jgi:hypothetical protein
MAEIFKNVDELIDASLGVKHIGSKSPHYRNIASGKNLTRKPAGFNCEDLLEAILNQMRRNLRLAQERDERSPSAENWRLEKKPFISERNRSQEKICEKRIVTICGDDWFNQMPTASGLINGTSEKHCNIDLVLQHAVDEYTFFELKYEDSTPLFASFEIMKYGLLYVLSRERASQLGYSSSLRVLAARLIHLCVLAPASYYSPYNLRWLQEEISQALSHLHTEGYRIDFTFQSMSWPGTDNEVVWALANRATSYPPI